MRPSLSTHVSAPSSALLRYLRKQNQDILFFTASSVTQPLPTRTSKSCLAVRHPACTRTLTTSPHRRATIASNLFDFDFLRPAPSKPASKILAPTGSDRCGSTLSNAVRGHRNASTDKGQWKHWWGHKGKKEKGLKSDNLPPLPSFLDDMGNGHGRSKTPKAGNELRLRCTEIDENGNVTTVNGEFKKSELMDKVRSSNSFH